MKTAFLLALFGPLLLLNLLYRQGRNLIAAPARASRKDPHNDR